MKRRLEIARGLMHRPKILFLDEPTLGLDPQTRRNIWEYIRRLNKEENLTIILTTHYMEEADYLCDRIGIIDHGKIIALDTPENLKKTMSGDVLIFETSDSEKFKNLLKFDFVKGMNVVSDRLNITVIDGEKAIPKLLDIASRYRIHVKSVNLKKPTLEDVFIHHTGRAIRDETISGSDNLKMELRRGLRR